MAGRTEAPERHEKQTAPKEHMESHVSHQVNDIRRTEGTSALKADHAKQSEDLQKKGVLPDLHLVGDAQKTLGDSRATAADKLSSVENLAKHGIHNIQVADADGKMRDYSIETNKTQGGKEMVHLYGKDDNGNNKIALRGVDNGNGTFSSEKDGKGNEVGFQGSKWGDNGNNRSNVGNVSDFQGTAAKAPDGQPAKPGQAVDAKPNETGTQPSDVKARGIGAPTGAEKAPESQAAPSEKAPAQPAAPGTEKAPAAQGSEKAPEKPAPGDLTKSSDDDRTGPMDRSQFKKELQDPNVREAFAGRIESEVGTLGPEAKKAFAEEVMNRAAARGQTISEALTNEKGHYYPTNKPVPSTKQSNMDAVDYAAKGSDITHGATGNASGNKTDLGHGWTKDADGKRVPRNTTLSVKGEHFGPEQYDVANGWMARYAKLSGADDAEQVAKQR